MWQGQQVALCHKERQPVGLLVLREKEQVKQFLGTRKVSANDFWLVNPERIDKKEIKTGRRSAAERLTHVRKGRWFESIRPDDGIHHLTHDVSSLEEQWCPRDPVCTPPRHTGHPQTWQWPGGLSSIRSRESSQQRCCPGHCRQPKVSCEIHRSGQRCPTQAEPTIDQPASMTKRSFHFSGTINRDE